MENLPRKRKSNLVDFDKQMENEKEKASSNMQQGAFDRANESEMKGRKVYKLKKSYMDKKLERGAEEGLKRQEQLSNTYAEYQPKNVPKFDFSSSIQHKYTSAGSGSEAPSQTSSYSNTYTGSSTVPKEGYNFGFSTKAPSFMKSAEESKKELSNFSSFQYTSSTSNNNNNDNKASSTTNTGGAGKFDFSFVGKTSGAGSFGKTTTSSSANQWNPDAGKLTANGTLVAATNVERVETIENGEDGEKTLFSFSPVKLYVKVDNEWCERGMGLIKLNKKDSSHRIIVRSEHVNRLMLNVMVDTSLPKPVVQEEQQTLILCGVNYLEQGEKNTEKPSLFCLRFRNSDQEKFKEFSTLYTNIHKSS